MNTRGYSNPINARCAATPAMTPDAESRVAFCMGRVVNRGIIQAATGGSVRLLGKQVKKCDGVNG